MEKELKEQANEYLKEKHGHFPNEVEDLIDLMISFHLFLTEPVGDEELFDEILTIVKKGKRHRYSDIALQLYNKLRTHLPPELTEEKVVEILNSADTKLLNLATTDLAGFQKYDEIHLLIDSAIKTLTQSKTVDSGLVKKNKQANEFIVDIANLLNIDTDGLGYDGLQLTIDNFAEAIQALNKNQDK